MRCTPCTKNGKRREGYDLALCWQHRRTKCRLCGGLSAGKTYCTKCQYHEEIERWKAESKSPWLDQDFDEFQLRLRKERLYDAKYHAHRATEIHFRALVLTLEAIWGGIKTPEEIAVSDEPPRPPQDGGSELKEAA